ncbi:Bug family tripartite tricarboxylate transporter substrate binding protein [Variovorax sp. M-6]|uniref:Bug family tripartite tricarboxylate transporter substrate binding protein n=1 Tax=Variovorax sp. M-6 TaxID=3233041 RepID=UPI003F9E292C
MRLIISRIVLLVAMLLVTFAATADTYPSKPIRILIGTAPGGGTDGIARLLGDALSTTLKVPVVVENRPGASGQMASEQVLKAPPDGYTIMIAQNGHVTNPTFSKKLPYDTLKDFTSIAPLAKSPLVLVSSSASNVKSWTELVALSKRDSKSLSFATADSSARLAVEQIRETTGLPLVALPYKGTALAATDVAGGHVQYSVTTMSSVLPFQSTGKINYLATLARERSRFIPNVPTLSEQGVADVEVLGWWAAFGPANLPAPVIAELSTAIRSVLAQPQVRDRLRTQFVEPWIGTPQELDKFVRSEISSIQQLAKKANIQPE